MFCIDPVISGPRVVVPAVSEFVQTPMKRGLLCIVWQFDVGSLPKWDRSLIRRKQEILKQIWELTFELGVLTGTDPSVWQLSISPPYSCRTNWSVFRFWLGRRCVQDLVLQSHSSSAVLVLSLVQKCKGHIPMLQKSQSSICCLWKISTQHGRNFKTYDKIATLANQNINSTLDYFSSRSKTLPRKY